MLPRREQIKAEEQRAKDVKQTEQGVILPTGTQDLAASSEMVCYIMLT